ncbi:hypothetical protein [Allorhizocola rhizosphaerae]|uniref:hypothetical protein n=1 Tax=Allorhizocola rhizosphaerae TaxID=1872709 RepID=UPI000E3CEC12|nr:hypothetical protein [Allorhizocola rhizosphaerae]
MSISKLRNRLAGITAATVLLAGIGLVATTSGAAASKGPDAITGAAAAPGVQSPSVQILGTWFLTTDWGCDGSITGSFTQTFNADGTWSGASHNGRWFQVGNVIVWSYNTAAGLQYAGNVSGSWISGVQGYTNGTAIAPGCFGGRVNGVASVGETDSKVDPAIGK